ncbi:MAG TPA: energy transducer TonB [Gammaproteobacteria bacterium]|nr:energy transducer TonB [Gammaproteobacteria bacterium]
MTQTKDTGRQSDLLLYVAGAVVAAVGVTWLVLLKPWGSSAPPPAEPPAPTQTLAIADTPPPPAGDEASSAPSAALDNPLRMADLAFQAGMLVEPEEYSAWTLYRGVVKSEPGNAAAVQGLNKVADELVRRGETALEQGRFDDARAVVERIRAALPAHAGAKALAEKIWPAGSGRAAVAESSFKPEIPVQAPPPKVAPVQVHEEAPPKPVVDPVVELNQKFEDSMTAGRLLTPPDQSAKRYVEQMISKHPTHDLTRAARDRLSHEFLARSSQSLEARDTDAAGIWIDEAEHLGADPNAVRTARAQLVDLQIALESAKPIPASALKVKSYAKPVYPSRALDRGVEGWVDIEFTVEPDGSTSHVAVAGASHEQFFRKEAVAAVEQWKFEPRVFMNRPIAQRSYTRISFKSQ